MLPHPAALSSGGDALMSLCRRFVIVPAAAVVSLTAPAVASEGSCTHPLFAAAVAYDAGIQPRSVAIGDLDGVNGPDLAVANGEFGSNDVSVLLNQGDGTFAAPVAYDVGPAALSATPVSAR